MLEAAARLGDDLGLLGLAVRGQVAGQQDEVDASAERARTPRAIALAPLSRAVDVAGGGDPDRRLRRFRHHPSAHRFHGHRVPPWRAPGRTTFDVLLETLKRSAAALREAEIPFLLGGGLAAWARGGPQSTTIST